MRELWIVLFAVAIEVPIVVGIARWRRWTAHDASRGFRVGVGRLHDASRIAGAHERDFERESPDARPAGRRTGWKSLAAIAVAATMLTHPPMALAAGRLSGMSGAMRWTVLELAVVLVEAALYAGPGELGWRRGLVVSTVANAASFAAGLALAAPA